MWKEIWFENKISDHEQQANQGKWMPFNFWENVYHIMMCRSYIHNNQHESGDMNDLFMLRKITIFAFDAISKSVYQSVEYHSLCYCIVLHCIVNEVASIQFTVVFLSAFNDLITWQMIHCVSSEKRKIGYLDISQFYSSIIVNAS